MIEFRFWNRLPDCNRVYELGEVKSGRVPSGNANAAQRYYMLLSVSKMGNLKNIVLDDADFVKFVNDYPAISKAFVAHKTDITQSQIDNLNSILKLSNVPAKVTEWAERGFRLRNMLIESKNFDDYVYSTIQKYYEDAIGRQITLKIKNLSTNENDFEIVADYIARDHQSNKLIIIDSKYTTKSATDFDYIESLTENQDRFISMVKNPNIKFEIEVRANNTKLIGLRLSQGDKITIDEIGIQIIQSEASNVNAIQTTIIIK